MHAWISRRRVNVHAACSMLGQVVRCSSLADNGMAVPARHVLVLFERSFGLGPPLHNSVSKADASLLHWRLIAQRPRTKSPKAGVGRRAQRKSRVAQRPCTTNPPHTGGSCASRTPHFPHTPPPSVRRLGPPIHRESRARARCQGARQPRALYCTPRQRRVNTRCCERRRVRSRRSSSTSACRAACLGALGGQIGTTTRRRRTWRPRSS